MTPERMDRYVLELLHRVEVLEGYVDSLHATVHGAQRYLYDVCPRQIGDRTLEPDETCPVCGRKEDAP